jgi:hypothetical protein
MFYSLPISLVVSLHFVTCDLMFSDPRREAPRDEDVTTFHVRYRNRWYAALRSYVVCTLS